MHVDLTQFGLRISLQIAPTPCDRMYLRRILTRIRMYGRYLAR